MGAAVKPNLDKKNIDTPKKSITITSADVMVMLFLGVSMFFLSKFGFTAAPIVLGLILGPIAETNFSQAKIIADTQNGIFDYLTMGPLNLTIISLCILSIIYGLLTEIKKKTNDKDQ